VVGYGGLRDMSSIIESALEVYNLNWLSRFKSCGKLFIGLRCSNCGKPLAIPSTCKLRVCPSCSKKIASKLFRKYLPLFKGLIRCGLLSLLTLTIRNIYNMEIGIIKLKKCIHEFLKKRYVRKRIIGGIYAIEVKEDENGWFNIHVHFLIVHKYFGRPSKSEIRHLKIPSRLQDISKDDLINNSYIYINGDKVAVGQLVLSAFWEQISGDPVIDIRRVRSPKAGLRYVLKYVLKPPRFSTVEAYVEFLRAFKHKPRVVPLGGCRGSVIEEKYKLKCDYCGSSSFVFVRLLYGEEIEEFLLQESPPGG